MQAKSIWLNTPWKLSKIIHRGIFWFFLCVEEFVSRTISDGSIDLLKFPASRVRQLAKRMESFKATMHHIKQVAGDPQAAQINLLRHQCTEVPAGKYKKKKSSVMSIQSNHEQHGMKVLKCQASTRSDLMSRLCIKIRTDVPNVVIQLT